jgi:hypothetical protein
MKIPEKRKVTLMLDTDVYLGLRQKVGSRGLGEYMSQLARPHVVTASLEESYRALAGDTKNTSIGNEWDTIDPVIAAENVWRL